MIYLDNAATSWPKPPSVYETLGSFLQTLGANPGRAGHRMAAGAAAAVADCRLRLARLMNAESPDHVVFASNATDALNLAIRGLLRPGDQVITSSMEHNSLARPLRSVAEQGVQVTKVLCSPQGVIDHDVVAAAASPRLRLIAVTHASNVNGAIQPIEDLAEIAHHHKALLLVDGAQTLGAMPMDVQSMGIDLLAFPGHKSLLGPPGTGGLYVGPQVDLATFTPQRSGGTGVRSEDDAQPLELPYRYESGTSNTVGIAGLAAGVRFLEEHSVQSIHQRESSLTRRLIAGLEGIEGVRVCNPPAGAPQAAVVSCVVDGWSPADVGSVLDQSFDIACRTGLHCAPDACRTIGAFPEGTVRLSPGCFTTEDEIDAAIAAVAEIASTPSA
ncbi:MAG: aminotransferase class V-fold PLP-dependent enzyme [Chloroflexota bacterium]|nr:aminotransferase class V-fold PLP-dependent enzyme [Chloroflexota bacterium]